jgi:hypothetical protein
VSHRFTEYFIFAVDTGTISCVGGTNKLFCNNKITTLRRFCEDVSLWFPWGGGSFLLSTKVLLIEHG